MSPGDIMSKLYKKPVEVRMIAGTLAAFLWCGRWLQVESCERVYIKRGYYDPYSNLPTFRVKAKTGGLYELVQDKAGWVLERVWD